MNLMFTGYGRRDLGAGRARNGEMTDGWRGVYRCSMDALRDAYGGEKALTPHPPPPLPNTEYRWERGSQKTLEAPRLEGEWLG
jgi:hypothetical protein